MDAPTTLTDLIEALAALPDLDPVERARRCPSLIEATKKVMKATREAAILEATDPPHRLSGVEVARALGIHPNKISEARKAAIKALSGAQPETPQRPRATKSPDTSKGEA